MRSKYPFVCWAAMALLPALGVAQEPGNDTETQPERLKAARKQMEKFELLPSANADPAPLSDHPLLTFGDSVRANESGTLWAWGKGRPLALLELYKGSDRRNWVHAATLTGEQTVVLKLPNGLEWTPKKIQIDPKVLPGAERPSAKETTRTRQLKELARRFTAHEFWGDDNDRYELRLLVQAVHRYQDPQAGLHDGAIFILAHGTNPEMVLMLEALGESLEESQWHYSLARLGSAEMHVDLDGKEIYAEKRTPGVVGERTDPYHLFALPASDAEE